MNRPQHRLVAYVDKEAFNKLKAILALRGTTIKDWVRAKVRNEIQQNDQLQD